MMTQTLSATPLSKATRWNHLQCVQLFSEAATPDCWPSSSPSHQITEAMTTALPTSGGRYLLLQDTDVELECELGGWAEECLDHRGPAECRPVCTQLAFGLAHFLLNFFWVPILGHLPLLRDADIRLFDSAGMEVNVKDLHTPTSKSVNRITGTNETTA